MSVMMTLAKHRKFKGIFTQRKILWGFLEELEGKAKTEMIEPIDSLVIQSDSGKIEGQVGEEKKLFITMTYAHLCYVMRDNMKIALHNSQTFEPVYGIWQSEPNILFTEDEQKENENE